jgi:hypothetical protein
VQQVQNGQGKCKEIVVSNLAYPFYGSNDDLSASLAVDGFSSSSSLALDESDFAPTHNLDQDIHESLEEEYYDRQASNLHGNPKQEDPKIQDLRFAQH